MKNKIFQRIWFTVRGTIPRKNGDGTSIHHYSARMFAQLKLAKKFGRVELVLLGDSNSENYSNIRDMSKFKGLSVSLGIGGTRADQWADFFDSAEGQILKEMIGDAEIVFNIGGNHVLQNHMKNVRKDLARLRAHFPRSYCVTIPPIHTCILSLVGFNTKKTRDAVIEVNGYIKQIWGEKAIDIYQLFMAPNGEAYPGLLVDPVHYGPIARNIIVKEIKRRTGM